MKALLATIGVAVTLSVAWLAGEQHRENCLRDNRTGCTVFPWDAGKERGSELTDEQRRLLKGVGR